MEQSWKMFRQRDLTRRFLHCSPTTTATNVNTDALCSNELMFARNNVNGSIIKPIPMNGCECTIRTATTLTSKSGTDIECKLSHRTTTTMDHYDDQRRLASRRTIIGPGKYTLVMMITFFFILVLQHFPSCKYRKQFFPYSIFFIPRSQTISLVGLCVSFSYKKFGSSSQFTN